MVKTPNKRPEKQIVEIKPPPRSAMVVPALIVGGAILAGAVVVKSSLDNTAEQLGSIRAGLDQAQVALSEVAKANNAAPAAAPARRRGPDPDKRYTLKTTGRPTKGASGAKVEIVEFSDFQ